MRRFFMICRAIQTLINYGIKNELITKEDEIVVRNTFIDILGLTDWEDGVLAEEIESVEAILAPIIDYACEKGIIADTTNSRDLFDTKIMGVLTAMPREVNSEFRRRYAISPKEATDWYYQYSRRTNYVRAERIAKDLVWTHGTDYGVIDITINRSKPEKDPRDIAAAKLKAASSYPKCQLCSENAGFAGHATHPARQNLRPIPITVNNEGWDLQYSPYGYYNEHCIVFNKKHIPMKIDRAVFSKLFDIVDQFPHYFVGSNADLPIVGGSILSHEHFQGGRYTFAMEKAEIEREFEFSKYPDVRAGIVKWPMSVIRLCSENRASLAECCDHVLEAWRAYSDPAACIFAETEGTPHNTITPIARKSGDTYVCDLVLRNNLTTDERPLGLYHPGPALHHIKKENIGLIEVMGLAVLPARLANELAVLEKAILDGADLDAVPETASHAEWARDVVRRHPELNPENARKILEDEVGEVFLMVLMDAGVFKRDGEGQAAFDRFVDSIK
jgi:UDPglucose--hexose-1-phosphate uridylyltransferase